MVMVVATTSAAAGTTAVVRNAGPVDPTRLGFARLMRLVSASVMGGFMFGVGLILILGQLADATGWSLRARRAPSRLPRDTSPATTA